LVLLCGYVEGFIRDLVEEAVDHVNELRLEPDRLPVGLLSAVLQAIMEFSGAKRDAAVDQLKAAWKREAACELDAKRLSSTGGNPTVETVESIFSVFGLSAVIDTLSIEHYGIESTFVYESQSAGLENAISGAVGGDLGSIQAVLAVIDRKWQPRRKRRQVGYVSALQEMLRRRHRIAHGESREIVTPQELALARADMERFCVGLHDLLESRLAALRNSDADPRSFASAAR
jgi:hypothetical protein